MRHRVQELVGALRRGRGGCLVVEEPAAVAVSDPDGVSVVRYRASVDEQLLAYAALSELCSPFGSLIDDLPPVQAAALSGALALGPPQGDALAVATGFRSLLHLVAERRPLLLVVEHAHLLDRGSAAAVSFAARRIEDAPIGLLVAQDPSHPGRLELPDARRLRGTTAAGATASPAAPTAVQAIDRARDRGSAADLGAALFAEASAHRGAPRSALLVEAGGAWLDAGQVEQALTAATEARRLAARDVDVGAAELLLGRVHGVLGNGRVSADHLRAAADAAAAEEPRTAVTALLLMVPGAVFGGRVDAAEAVVAEAGSLVDKSDLPADDPIRAMHAAAGLALALARGEPVDAGDVTAAAERVVDAGDGIVDLPLVATTVALPLVWLERYGQARALLGDLIARLRRRGALGALPMPLCALSVAERRSGRPSQALILASEARDLADQTGNRAALLFAQAELANVHSLFGDVDRCRAAAQVVLGPGGPGRGTYRTSALSALATVELWTGDPTVVIDLLEPLVTEGEGLSQAVTLFEHTLLTAYVAVGRQDDARRLLADLEAAVPATSGRLAATVARCAAVLAPLDERDHAFAKALEQAHDQPVSHGLTRVLQARRLLADGELSRGAAILHELSDLTDENLLGVARAARLSLARLGLVVSSGDPAWARLGPDELQVALAAIDETPSLTLADRLRLSPPEVERLRDEVVAVVGARSGPQVAAGMHRTVGLGGRLHEVEVRLLGGLAVLDQGRPVALPAGAASITVALLAIRRAAHVEELTEVLWPGVPPAVARRRLRNVLTRIRQAAGPIVARHGDRVELAAEVVVDHHLLERRARRALAAPNGPERAALLAAALEEDRGPLLPEAAYEEWAEAARRQAEVRHEDLVAALAEEQAAAR